MNGSANLAAIPGGPITDYATVYLNDFRSGGNWIDVSRMKLVIKMHGLASSQDSSDRRVR